jgi:hypothetical protein
MAKTTNLYGLLHNTLVDRMLDVSRTICLPTPCKGRSKILTVRCFRFSLAPLMTKPLGLFSELEKIKDGE